jgi:surface protein
MAKNDNLKDFLTDVADAIRAKKGTTAKINPQDFSSEIASISSGDGSGESVTPSRPTYTGHADAEGLRAIGWTDEDIAYYQENGVNWNEEDDEYHKVTDDNKALYGVLTADNISDYKDRIVYLPKIDTSDVTDMANMFNTCRTLVSIPQLDTSNVTNMSYMFAYCSALASIPQLDTSSVTNMNSMFYYCYSLVSIPQLDTSSVTNMNTMFYYCYSLVSIPQLDTSSVTNMRSMFHYCCSLVSIPQLDTSSVTNMSTMFQYCQALVYIPQLDTSSVTNMSNMFTYCFLLTYVSLKNATLAYQFSNSTLLSKESLLYLINNEAATEPITIKLASYAYTRLANDPDIVAALTNHPNISLAK